MWAKQELPQSIHNPTERLVLVFEQSNNIHDIHVIFFRIYINKQSHQKNKNQVNATLLSTFDLY